MTLTIIQTPQWLEHRSARHDVSLEERTDREAGRFFNCREHLVSGPALRSTNTTMNALVGYGSSDEEEEDVLPQRPAKVDFC